MKMAKWTVVIAVAGMGMIAPAQTKTTYRDANGRIQGTRK